jgi:Flp pilus assembly protein TadD
MEFSESRSRVPGQTSGRRTIIILAVLLAVGSAVLYAPAVRNGFVNYDDPDYITNNVNVQRGLTWPGIVWAFGTKNDAANWHPLTWISHMLDVGWFGMNPAGHHFMNVLLFAIDIAVLFLFLTSATGCVWRSAAVAALFAVHPLNVESVAWAAERKAVLSILFLLLTLWSYWWYTRRPGVARYLAVVSLYALALLSKTTVITLPASLLLLDYWPLRRLGDEKGEPRAFLRKFGRLALEKMPLFLMAGVVGVITFQIHRREGAMAGAMLFTWRLKNSIYSYVAYLGKTIWPTGLAVFYPHPENSLSWWMVGLAALALVGITAMVWRLRARRYLLVGWLWYLGILLPMIGLVQSGRQGMADRYVCISLLGLFVGIVWRIGDWAQQMKWKREPLGAVFVLLLLPFAYLTRVQIGYWRNSLTLFGHALDVTSNNAIAEANFGSALVEAGETQLAEQHLDRALRLAPDIAQPHYNLAVILQGQGHWKESEREYRLALERLVDPMEKAQAHNNLGTLYLQIKQIPAAQKEFTEAIALNPNEVNSYLGRGILEQQSANYPGAIADFTEASRLQPGPAVYFWLGQAFEGAGDYNRAQNAYVAALRMAPGMSEAQARLETVRKRAEGTSR